MSAPSVGLVRAVVYGAIGLTLFHFTDNAVNIDDYPKAGWQPDWFAALVVAGWFIWTAVGIYAVRLYEQGRFRGANTALIIYGYLVASSIGHFLYGSPSELETHSAISVFVDIAAGLVVIGVGVWSVLARRSAAAPTG
jgi:hypothetical protein